MEEYPSLNPNDLTKIKQLMQDTEMLVSLSSCSTAETCNNEAYFQEKLRD